MDFLLDFVAERLWDGRGFIGVGGRFVAVDDPALETDGPFVCGRRGSGR